MHARLEARAALDRLAVHMKHHRPVALDRRPLDPLDRPPRRPVDAPREEPRHGAECAKPRDSSKTTRSSMPSSRRAPGAMRAPFPNCDAFANVTRSARRSRVPASCDAVRRQPVREELAHRDPHVGREAAPAGDVPIEARRDVRIEADARELKNSRPPSSPASIARGEAPSASMRARIGPPADAKIGRQAVARSGWHDGERRLPEHQGRGHLVDRAVAAPGDDQPRAAGDRGRRQLARMPLALGDEHLAALAATRRAPTRPAPRALRAALGPGAAGDRVDDDGDHAGSSLDAGRRDPSSRRVAAFLLQAPAVERGIVVDEIAELGRFAGQALRPEALGDAVPFLHEEQLAEARDDRRADRAVGPGSSAMPTSVNGGAAGACCAGSSLTAGSADRRESGGAAALDEN